MQAVSLGAPFGSRTRGDVLPGATTSAAPGSVRESPQHKPLEHQCITDRAEHGTIGALPRVMTTSNDPRGADAGYTLVELVMVLTILAIASALAAPQLAGLRRGQELESAAVGLARHLRTAQWRAVVSGDRARVSARQEAGSWRFRIERERGGAWVPEGETQVLPPGAIVAIAGPQAKVFNPDGTCSLGSITVRGAAGAVYRCTLAPATGRVRFYRGDRESGRGL